MKSTKFKTKQEKGITLMALIITIVVLLILATVAINSVLNDGIISKAQDVANKFNEAQANEQNMLDEYLNYLNPGNGENPVEYEKVADAKTSGKTFTSNTTLQDDNGNLVKVPTGFKIASDSATVVTGGVVIEDTTYTNTIGSQFVWIPTGNIKTSPTDTTGIDITLARYTFDVTVNMSTMAVEGTGEESEPIISAEAEVRDPLVTLVASMVELGDVYFVEGEIEGIDDQDKGYALSISNFYNSAKPIEEGGNGGYYIGRYEARKNSTTNKLTTVGEDGVYNNIEQPEATSESQGMYAGNSNFTSDLVNSYAWDTAIVFIQKFGGEGFGNYSMHTSKNTGGLAERGTNNLEDTTKQDVVCNIWDMASNCTEWSTETNSSLADRPGTGRGGYYGLASCCSGGRLSVYAETDSVVYYSFRPVLYL